MRADVSSSPVFARVAEAVFLAVCPAVAFWVMHFSPIAQQDFIGTACGLGFDEQVVPELPVLDHDIPLSMLVTDRGLRRFATNCIQK